MKRIGKGIATFFASLLIFAIIAALIFPQNEAGSVDIPDWYFNTMLIVSIIAAIPLTREKRTSKKNQKTSATGDIWKALLVLLVIFFLFGGLLSLNRTTNGIAIPLVIVALIALAAWVISNRIRANRFMRKNGIYAVALNNMINESYSLSQYFEKRDELLELLRVMAKMEFWVNEKNQLTEKPSHILKVIEQNENTHVHEAIMRAMAHCKQLIREDGPGYSRLFSEHLEKCSDRLCPENLHDAHTCLHILEDYEKQIEQRELEARRTEDANKRKKLLSEVGVRPMLDFSDFDAKDVILALESQIGSLYKHFISDALSPEDGKRAFVAFRDACYSSTLPLAAEVRLESLLAEYEQKFSAETPLYAIDHMEGHEFEYWCASLLRRNGFFGVEVTQGSGDQGVDITATKDGIRYAIQCKCYSSDLGNKPVQEVHTGKSIYHCQVGAVMTNRYFTAGARQAAEATGTLLWDRDKLVEMLEK